MRSKEVTYWTTEYVEGLIADKAALEAQVARLQGLLSKWSNYASDLEDEIKEAQDAE